MNWSTKTKEELILELQELTLKNNLLKTSFDAYVTEWKVREIELVKSEEKFRKAFITNPDSININRLGDGMYIIINEGFTKIMGYTPDDVIGKTSIELNIWANPEDRNKLIKGLNANGKVENLEAVFISKDGSTKNGLMSATVIEIEGESHILSITRDITDRKRMENVIRENEIKYSELIEMAPDGILLGSEKGLILQANTKMLKITGRKLEDLIGSDIGTIFSADELKLSPLRYDLLRKGVTITNERNVIRPDGMTIPIEMHSKQMPGGLFLAFFHDITERRKSEQALNVAKIKVEASDKLKTSFLNNISHEVRTPLNGILGFAEIISNGDLSSEEKEEALTMVHESSNRLLETITNYMDISLLVSGEMTVAKAKFIPGDLLSKLFEKYNSVCLNKNVVLSLNIPTDFRQHYLDSDSDLIGKILTQLIGNAIKFTDKGTIKIGYRVKNREIEFFVSDTGIGITKGSERSVFNHFEKEEQNKSKPSEGSGLGLSISKGIVELLGGKIWMESEPDKGTKFFFSLPGISIPVSESHSVISTARNIREKLKLILVAEDDSANFMYLSALLRQSTTAKIIRAENGREAIEKFKENPGIEIILMDMKMPEMNGFEATKVIKSLNPLIPVIAITAYAMLGDEKRVLDSGCDAYLSKPISRERLFEKLAAFVNI